MEKPKIAITMGDPAGIGPELCLRAVSEPAITSICVPVIFGDADILKLVAKRLKMEFRIPMLVPASDLELTGLPSPVLVQASSHLLELKQGGTVSAATGRASFDFVETAIQSALKKVVSAVVTSPIHKEAWSQAGINFPGHTELFAARSRSDKFCMMMTSPRLTCSLVTTHIGLSSVPKEITSNRVLDVIELTNAALARMRKRAPRLAVLGLNPHAGEGGLFGNREEENLLMPAIETAQERGILVEGPLPADTAFLPQRLAQIDGHICMYHDQGLIPFKTLAFDTGVNTTLGLPIVRTSVDHGTACDIAWQGTADPSSLFAAIELAVSLST